MLRFFASTAAATVMLAPAAHAGDKVLYAAAPSWVKPVAAAPVPAKPDDAPVRMLLSDQQVAFDRGRQTVYSNMALLIQTPAGLGAGNISVPWNPEIGDLTVHRLAIRRDGRVIDVLAGGQTFSVVRRESNLESAMLDGVLTANIQPEGLQVGDVLEFAASVSAGDPVLKGHVEAVVAGWDVLPSARSHLHLRWPATLPVRLRQGGTLPRLTPVTAGGITSVALVQDATEPVPGPKGAPLRYHLGRRVEASDFASWADVGTLFAPLYAAAATVPAGTLADEVARIAAATTDPTARAEAALALVQNRIRYVALAMGGGGFVPADVATTWSRRYGDCKGKSVMLIAVLRALGIAAEPVLVHTQAGDGLDERLPMVGAFDHVIVRAEVGGRSYWLDGTRTGDTRLARLPVPAFGWALPVRPAGASLIRLARTAPDAPLNAVTIRMDARGGIDKPAPTTIETVLRGDEAIGTNAALSAQSGEARDRALRAYWKSRYDFIEADAVSATFDPATGEQRLTLTGRAKMDWSSGWYETDGTGMGYRADFARDPGPDRDAPFAVTHPFHNRVDQTILLPAGVTADALSKGADVDRSVAGIHYRRTATIRDGVFHAVATERSTAPEFPASDAPAAQEALRAMAKATLYIRAPRAAAKPGAPEVVSIVKLDDDPMDAAGKLLDQGKYAEAQAQYDRALVARPTSPEALAGRALTRIWRGDYDPARPDIAAAFAADANHPTAYRARGLLAYRTGEYRQAVAAFTSAIEADPEHNFARHWRTMAHVALRDYDAALVDAAALIERNPQAIAMYGVRADIFHARRQPDRVLAEVTALAEAGAENADAHVLAAYHHHRLGRADDVARSFDRALAIRPSASIYLNRAASRPATDRAGKLADIDAALALEPGSVEAGVQKAHHLDRDGRTAQGLAVLAAWPADAVTPDMLASRGILHAKLGDAAAAERDFAAARARITSASDFNNLCWAKAIAGVALPAALTECDRAVAMAPDVPAYIDSRALVLLRLDRLDDAVAAYDRALALAPDEASFRYGRAVALARRGDARRAAADRAAAVKAEAGVAARFAEWGVTMPAPPARR